MRVDEKYDKKRPDPLGLDHEIPKEMRRLEGGFDADVATRACSFIRLARQDPGYEYRR